MKKIVILVPAFNEESTIFKTVKSLGILKEKLEAPTYDLKIIVVDDGSTDGTKKEAERALADFVISHSKNQGLGAAVRTGLETAHALEADIAIKFDADLQHDPLDIIALIKPLEQSNADIVYGHRFNRISYKMPFIRRIGNRVFTSLMRWLTGWDLKDSQPGIFAVNQNYLNVFRIPRDYNYTQQILLDAACKRMQFSHVDVSFKERVHGKSFVSLKYPFKVFPQLFWVLVGVRPLKVFIPVGLFFIGCSSFVFFYQVIQYIIGITSTPVVNVNFVLGFGLFGLQVLLFGVLAELIAEIRGLISRFKSPDKKN